MPQTMPMDWFSLYIFMTLLFIILNIKMFYSHKKSPLKKFKLLNKKLSWKW
uniref:ATP synthase F0 subunit 8 n=1 Tax=Harmonia axyridis TaxID=115357 RepID=A0A0U2DC96_HARAX|nr:ATP synthase FO subunit 8 [Harmonia axyridis]ANW48064.1 atp8 [Harmonia axyridis]ARI43892.1 ATP synthase F0 subunit 8 [Harmonia axyridis]ARI43900.1 ATP synthase F0 subunit 8 [Harmonia axyridis]